VLATTSVQARLKREAKVDHDTCEELTTPEALVALNYFKSEKFQVNRTRASEFRFQGKSRVRGRGLGIRLNLILY